MNGLSKALGAVAVVIAGFSATALAQQGERAEDEVAETYADSQERDSDRSSWDKALQEDAPAVCDQAGDLRDMCIRELAIKRKDVRLCSRITARSGDSAKEQDKADHCIRGYAVDVPDPAVCGMIVDHDIRLRCINESNKADSPQLCDSFEDDELQSSCMMNLAIDTADLMLCERIRDRYVLPERRFIDDPADNCISSIAVNQRNPELCFTARSSLLQAHCIRNIAWELKKPELCESIVSSDVRRQCRRMFGRR